MVRILIISILFLSFYSCKKRGCTDYEALNYDSEAEEDDNSCYYFWVGQNYQGGKIFYIDQSRKHGLIAAEFDLGFSEWGCYKDSLTDFGINDGSVGRGSHNTEIIFNNCGVNTAAGKCLMLDTLGFNDWFLPSLEEMRGLALNLGTINQGKLESGYYWTSTQATADHAYLILVGNQGQAGYMKQIPYSVRPVRSF